jgi:hypothetical protein
MPAENYNAPVVVTFSWLGSFYDDRLRVNSVSRWRDSTTGLVKDARLTAETPYGTTSGSSKTPSSQWLSPDPAGVLRRLQKGRHLRRSGHRRVSGTGRGEKGFVHLHLSARRDQRLLFRRPFRRRAGGRAPGPHARARVLRRHPLRILGGRRAHVVGYTSRHSVSDCVAQRFRRAHVVGYTSPFTSRLARMAFERSPAGLIRTALLTDFERLM